MIRVEVILTFQIWVGSPQTPESVNSAGEFVETAAIYLDEILVPLLSDYARGVISTVEIEKSGKLRIVFPADGNICYKPVVKAVHDSLSTMKSFPLVSEHWEFERQ